ncbi:MAG TPA: CsgG/HfaB family protein [Moraxellaceae bacterium]|nr:CsgG/HfaB family protein [Moraxellaceae bacterium]
MRLSLRLAGALAMAASLFAPVALAARPTIAVLPFSIDKDVVVRDGHNAFTATIEDQTPLLSNELIQQLVATHKFDVLERARLDDILAEKDLAHGDYAAPEEAPRLAKLLGADYLVVGRIEDLSGSSEEKSLPYSSRTYVLQRARIEMYLRIVDARTGRIVAAEKFASEARLRDARDSNSIGKRLVERAAQDTVGRIMDSVFPLRVARIEGSRLFINRGNDGSLRPGDTLAVLAQGAPLRDSDTGEDIGTADSEVARATVTAVNARYSEAEVTGNASSIHEGMRLRPAEPVPAPAAAPADLPPGPRW